MKQSRKYLSTEALLARTRETILEIKMNQTKGNRKESITLADCLMAALAMFGLKFPSLLQFDEYSHEEKVVKHNLKALYQINNVPSDTYMRERLDEVDPQLLRKNFTLIFSDLQRGNALEEFQFINGHYLLPIDGTGFFSSHQLSCNNCCVREHRDGTKTYYHQVLCGAIVHPNKKQVIPFAPEPIKKSDGSTKNDCEYNAAKRFIADFRREHPHLKVILTADGLLSKASMIELLKTADMRFIIGAKPGDHKSLFEFVKPILQKSHYHAKDGTIHEYSYANKVPINSSNTGIEVNFLDYIETSPQGKVTKFTWITDILINEGNIHQIMKGGRARWKIENETFNTLKNQNYNFEHNFGHGKKWLSTIFAMLMVLAFTLDQAQEIGNKAFQQALTTQKRKRYLWDKLRGLFVHYFILSWTDLWGALGIGREASILTPLNSS